MINWFQQVVSVTWFGLTSVPQRLGSVAAAVFGIAGVVAVLVSVLSMAAGFRRTMNSSSSPDSVIVLRTGSNNEMDSGVQQDQARVVAEIPGLARSAEG